MVVAAKQRPEPRKRARMLIFGSHGWWWPNNGQNPENEHECSFSGSRGWWRPENGWGHGGGSQTGFWTWWWQLNNSQNPKNEQKYSFSGSRGWWWPENGCGHGGGGRTMVGARK